MRECFSLHLRRLIPAGLAWITAVSPYCVHAQTASQEQAEAAGQTPTITTQSTLVLVPALVHDKSGQLVFNLKVDDFTLTDNGIPQTPVSYTHLRAHETGR